MADEQTNFQVAPTQEEAERLADRVMGWAKADEVMVEIAATTTSEAEFARNELSHLEGDTEILLDLGVSVGGKRMRLATHDLTEGHLSQLVEEAQDLASSRDVVSPGSMLPAQSPVELPKGMFFESTAAAASPEAHGSAVLSVVEKSRKSDFLTAGTLLRETGSSLIRSTSGYGGFSRYSYAEFSMSARTKTGGTGAGWAWAGNEDANKVDVDDVASRAIDLATRTENAVAVEPGRYTVILEPEATAQILREIMMRFTSFIQAEAAETAGNVFSRPGGGTRVGEQMTDPRVQVLYDPYDPQMPFSPIDRNTMMKRTHWLRDGQLQTMAYNPGYARDHDLPVTPNPRRLRMDFDDIKLSREEMIGNTRRGILVTRFSSLGLVDGETLLLSGVTRDGTFLIERGEISRPIRNMRFLESPFYLLNKIESAGVSVRSQRDLVTPRLLVNDFEFTALSDAI